MNDDLALSARRGYRLSDAERDRAIALLADAYAEGRLDHGEFEVRLEAASRAVLGSDLEPLFTDLPRSRAARAPARRPRNGPPFAALLFLGALALLAQPWLLILLAFVIAGHRGGRWSPQPPDARRQLSGCHPRARWTWR